MRFVVAEREESAARIVCGPVERATFRER